MAINHTTPRWQGYLAAFTVVCCWTGFNIVSRLGGKSVLTPFDVAALRFLVSGIVMVPVFFIFGNQLKKRQLLTIGTVGGFGYALCAYSGFMFAPAAHAGIIINGGIPLATAGIAWIFLKDKPKPLSLFALCLAALGVAIISLHSLNTHSSDTPHVIWGDIFFILAALAWSTFGILVRIWHIRPVDAMSGIGVTSLLIYIPIYLLFLPKGIQDASLSTIVLQGFYQGIIAALVAGFFYTFATLVLGSGAASLTLAIVPGTSAILAVPFLNEAITWTTGAGVVLVSIGALLGVRAKKEKASSA